MPIPQRLVLGVVAVGGAIGALARFGVDLAVPTLGIEGDFPWATLLVNVTGCVLIGALAVRLSRERSHARWWVRPLVITGVLGGFTTTSAYALETAALLDAGRWNLAVTYLVATLAGGLLAVLAGERMARVARS